MSIICKTKKGKKYYYKVTSARVDGKPRIVEQIYLGTEDKIAEAAKLWKLDTTNIPKPEFSSVYEFGAVSALFDVAERNGIREIIDKHADKRDQGLLIGDTMLLAAINRAVAASSKNCFYKWFKKTVLPSIFPKANKRSLSSQGFWNNMSILDADKIRTIESEITSKIVKNYDIPTDCLIFDNTNFFSYINTENPALIPKRGNSKEKRSDLKIIGLSLMVSPFHNIPLFHETYPGNTNDAKQFFDIAKNLKERYCKIGSRECDVTLIFDKGNNSEINFQTLISEKIKKFHFVGSLKLNQCPELLVLPKSEYSPLIGNEFKEAIAYRTKKSVFQIESTVIITYNPELYNAQLRGVLQNITKCKIALNELNEKLVHRETGIVCKGKKPTIESVKKNVNSILSADYMKKIFDFEIGESNGFITLSFDINIEKFENIKSVFLGKTILFKDQHNWSNEKIVGAYRSQYHVEECFRQMKNEKILTFRPVRHFTDNNIRVHAFYCILALTLSSLLNIEFERIDHKISINTMIQELNDSKQIISTFIINGKAIQKESFNIDNDSSTAVKEYINQYKLTKYTLKV
ncbi:MAG: IS1634 family transposase [Endomicrobium sp.]|nr:IS1634 family transposase [Endomicrobium sp.]